MKTSQSCFVLESSSAICRELSRAHKRLFGSFSRGHVSFCGLVEETELTAKRNTTAFSQKIAFGIDPMPLWPNFEQVRFVNVKAERNVIRSCQGRVQVGGSCTPTT